MTTASNRDKDTECYIRELGGEIWAELTYRIGEERANWEVKDQIVDVVMGVLARHTGKTIKNDRDLPVERLSEYRKKHE